MQIPSSTSTYIKLQYVFYFTTNPKGQEIKGRLVKQTVRDVRLKKGAIHYRNKSKNYNKVKLRIVEKVNVNWNT